MRQETETEDECSARTVREETRGKSGRARRGKVAHLRDASFPSRTVCGCNADSARCRVPSREAFDAAGAMKCRNCERMAPKLQQELDPSFHGNGGVG